MPEAPSDALSAEEQAQFDAMRDADVLPDASGEDTPAAPEPAPPAEDATTEPKKPPEEPPSRPTTVPLKTYLDERRKFEERLDQAAKDRQTLEERTNLILQRFATQPPPGQPQQPAAPTIPTVEQDPVGHIVGNQQQLGMNVQGLAHVLQMQLQQQQRQDYERQVKYEAEIAEQDFKAVTPDYDQAIAFAVQKRSEQLEIGGVANPVQRMQIIRSEAFQLAEQAKVLKENPASLLYRMAQSFGYQTPAVADPAAAQPAPVAADPALATPADKLATIAAGQEQARSLGNARGGAPTQMTAQRVVNMKPQEFDKWLSSATEDQMHEIYGA